MIVDADRVQVEKIDLNKRGIIIVYGAEEKEAENIVKSLEEWLDTSAPICVISLRDGISIKFEKCLT